MLRIEEVAARFEMEAFMKLYFERIDNSPRVTEHGPRVSFLTPVILYREKNKKNIF